MSCAGRVLASICRGVSLAPVFSQRLWSASLENVGVGGTPLFMGRRASEKERRLEHDARNGRATPEPSHASGFAPFAQFSSGCVISELHMLLYNCWQCQRKGRQMKREAPVIFILLHRHTS